MFFLGIETSCDETAVSVVENGTRVLSNAIASSMKDFSAMGGVIPEYAARRQLECMLPVVGQALADAGIAPDQLDAVAVTYGPGLLGSLLVGTTTARVLARLWRKPLIPVHHTLGHLSSVFLDSPEPAVFPSLTLSVSGGHTDLWYRTSHVSGQKTGTTLDDAAGEAFDKGAVLLGLPYPGGPMLAKLAEGGDEHAYAFPEPLGHQESAQIGFSFSGLKTSLKYLLRDLCAKHGVSAASQLKRPMQIAVAASYQHAICLHLTQGVIRALVKHPDIHEVHLAGGVSANARLRLMLAEKLGSKNISLRYPVKLAYCTDNAAMIAAAGYFQMAEKPETAGASFRASASDDLADLLNGTRSEPAAVRRG